MACFHVNSREMLTVIFCESTHPPTEVSAQRQRKTLYLGLMSQSTLIMQKKHV